MSYPELKPRNCQYGAPLGHSDWTPDKDLKLKLYMRKLEWRDYDYVEDGTYYGYTAGTHIYRAVGYGRTELNEVFVRATSRDDARRQVLEVFPKAKFYR